MSLRIYNRKRKFSETPEPRGHKKIAKSGDLKFVVQLHAATRLHFDFRLEFDGAFKSWAVPKGPSLNPLDQRLAVFVEDHPIDYGSFEGIIPKGNYGAGTVMVWDRGTYVERGSKARKDSERAMLKNFDKGHLTFVLDGEKLKGEFALIKLKKDASDKAWLLVKKRDAHSTYKRSEVPGDESVKTGRTMEEIAAEAKGKGDVWLPKKGRVGKPDFERPNGYNIEDKKLERKKKEVRLPRKVKPMIATLSKAPTPKDWLRDPRVDGVRALAEVENKTVSLYSKAGLSFNKKFPSIVNELKSLQIKAVFDGEIEKSIYYIYDILYWENQDLRRECLSARKKILKSAFKDTRHVKHVESFKSKQSIVKNPLSIYKGGTSADWRQVEERSSKATVTQQDGPQLTNLDKIYFPADKITKGDLLNYYDSIAPYILPYLKDRPESMNRHPNGIHRPGFYQKDLTGHIPRWLKTKRFFSESADKSIDYLLCQDKRSLLYMVNLGCIEINPWFSRVGYPDQPDFMVIDLDPDGNKFSHVVEIALEVHELLEAIGAKSFCKTSGATGIHIGVPMGAKYDFDLVRVFAENICRVIGRNNPGLTSLDRNPNRRRKKIYLDFMQNRRGQTLAAPFCVRPRDGAPVSMPLSWKELAQKDLSPGDFNIGNAAALAHRANAHWEAVLGPGIDLVKSAKILERKFLKD
jgi:bifunctional non-homologous end joining protein LigD